MNLRHDTPLSEEEFRRFTAYCNASDNQEDNLARAKLLGFTEPNVRVAPGAIIRIGSRQPGPGCFIGLYCYINGNVTIGRNVLIGPYCAVTAGHHRFDPATQSFSGRTDESENPIVIGEGSWLAAGCVVTAGVKIGRANLICANAVVTADTPDYAIMAGTPARQIGEIDPATGDYRWFNRTGGK